MSDEHCPVCGAGPLHATESDDRGRCARCAAEVVVVLAGDLMCDNLDASKCTACRALADKAKFAIWLWEQNPKRQALAKMLGREPGQITDEMIRQVERGPATFRNPPIQQIPRERRKSDTPSSGRPFTLQGDDAARISWTRDVAWPREFGTAVALPPDMNEIKYGLVRTKTGSKLHIASTGSSRTICGARVAMRLKYLTQHVEGCAACGIYPGTAASELGQQYGLEVR